MLPASRSTTRRDAAIIAVLTLAVLSQLRACANWHRIAREWIYGDDPVTGLGRQEAEFYGRTGVGAAG